MTLCHDLYLFIWETEGQREEVIFPKLQSQICLTPSLSLTPRKIIKNNWCPQ